MCFHNPAPPKPPDNIDDFRLINVAINKEAYEKKDDLDLRTINVHIKKEKPPTHEPSSDDDFRIINIDIKKNRVPPQEPI